MADGKTTKKKRSKSSGRKRRYSRAVERRRVNVTTRVTSMRVISLEDQTKADMEINKALEAGFRFDAHQSLRQAGVVLLFHVEDVISDDDDDVIRRHIRNDLDPGV